MEIHYDIYRWHVTAKKDFKKICFLVYSLAYVLTVPKN